MAYDEYQVERIRSRFRESGIRTTERNMMGGRIFFLEDKMCIGIHEDKNTGENLIMARVGEQAAVTALQRVGCVPMTFTGRAMKGYVFIKPEGYDNDNDLAYYIDLAVAFNPLAKASKKRKQKT